jgi:hypothetical protein
MRSSRTKLPVALAMGGFWMLLVAGMARAQARVPYTPSRYQALVSASTDANIPLGTVINAQNWQQYKEFLPIGLQEQFAGTFTWKAGTTADTSITVGPYHSYRYFKRWLEDTEKYSKDVRLVKLPDGGTSISGYTAGTPFPVIDPNDPDAGAKVYLNAWFGYRPWVSHWISPSFKVDSNGLASISAAETETYHLDHLSDSNEITKPGGKGSNVVIRSMTTRPEQSKYTTSLQIWTDDPNRPQETYTYLPSSRRPLRLSSAARCAPLAGTDNVVDDGFSGIGLQPSQFTFKYLGRKRLLLLAYVDASKTDYTLEQAYNQGPPIPAFPKPGLGTWEVRTVDIVDAQPVASNEGYCYSHRIVYFDTEYRGNLWIDIYDGDGNLWKDFELYPVFRPLTSKYVDKGETFFQQAQGFSVTRDFQNRHVSGGAAWQFTMDDDVPPPYQNYKVYSGPAGLQEIMR